MSKGFHIPFYVMPHWISVINIVKRYQLNSTGINFPFTGFLTAKCWLKIFGEYSKEILKVFPFSKFLNWFAKNAKNCHLPKIRWPFSEFVFYRIRYVWFVKGWVTFRFSYAKRHNDAEGGERLSPMSFENSEKLLNFKAPELSWTVNELHTRILRVPSSCTPIAHIHSYTSLWKNHPSAVFSSKMKHKRQKNPKQHTHKQQDNGN